MIDEAPVSNICFGRFGCAFVDLGSSFSHQLSIALENELIVPQRPSKYARLA
jgi:hypothetical protein